MVEMFWNEQEQPSLKSFRDSRKEREREREKRRGVQI